jgi:predicted acylesterase/phospholipase RssA
MLRLSALDRIIPACVRRAIALALAFAALAGSAAAEPRLAIVLSGGGSRGLAQIGVLKAFEENGIRPDFIVATSMGAVIGGLYSVGYSPDSIATIVKSTAWDEFFQNAARRRYLFVSQKAEPINYLFELRFTPDFLPLLPQSIAHGQSFYDLLAPHVAAPLFHAAMEFDSLPIPLRIVSTDVVSGRCVVFSRGSLATAVRASSSVPLAFAPVAMDSMLLLDGGLISNIPVEKARDAQAACVIAVDVTSPMYQRNDLNNPVRLVSQVIAIGVEKQKSAERLLADVIIRPDLEGCLNTDFNNMDTLINRGYVAALANMGKIKQRLAGLTPVACPPGCDSVSVPLHCALACSGVRGLERLDSVVGGLCGSGCSKVGRDGLLGGLRDTLHRRGFAFATVAVRPEAAGGSEVAIDPGLIRSIHVEGNARTSTRLILSASNLQIGKPLTSKLVARAISSLYATSLFNTVNIEMHPDQTVWIYVEEKEYLRARFGLRFDEYHLGEAYLQPAYENLFGSGISLLLHLQYGLRREKYSLEFLSSPLFSANWANNIRIQGYIARERITKDSLTFQTTDYFDTLSRENATRIDTITEHDEMTLRKAGILASLGTQIGHSAMIDGGVRLERFKLNRSDAGAFEDPLGPSFKQGIRYLMVRLTVDDLDRFPFPRKGQKHYITVGGASDVMGGTENFLKIRGSLGYYFTLKRRHTFSPQLQFAWTNKPLHDVEVERVYVGGAMPEEKYPEVGVYNHVPFMGLRPRALNGDILLLAHAAYRFEIVRNFYSIVNVDWGRVYEQPEFTLDRAMWRDFLRQAPLGLGIGLAYGSPVGPLKFSWSKVVSGSAGFGKSIRRDNVFYFSAGYDF